MALSAASTGARRPKSLDDTWAFRHVVREPALRAPSGPTGRARLRRPSWRPSGVAEDRRRRRRRLVAPSHGICRILRRAHVATVRLDPIRGNRPLGITQRHMTLAHHPNEHRLQLILPISVPTIARLTRLGPKIPGIVRRSTEIERNEMVFLIRPKSPVAVAILPYLPTLERLSIIRRRADRSRPPANTDRRVDGRFGHGGIDGARCQPRIRKRSRITQCLTEKWLGDFRGL
jgi:hypothetical protein